MQALATRALDPREWKVFMRRNKGDVMIWAACLVVVLFVYHFLSDGDFSFLLTLGSMARLAAFCMLLYKVWSQQSVAGVSLKSLQCYAVVFLFHFLSVVRHQGYLPFDSSGDWFYQLIEFVALCAVVALIVLTQGRFKHTYNGALDVFGAREPVPHQLGAVWLVGPALLLALFVHPTLNNSWFVDTAWAFANYVEAVAVLPQLFMFTKSDGKVEGWTSHYVMALGLSRFLCFVFWLVSFRELNTGAGNFKMAGYAVILSQLVHLLLIADFAYHYIASVRQGRSLQLPTSNV